MNKKDNTFIMKHGNVANKIRLLPSNPYNNTSYNIQPLPQGVHPIYSKYYIRKNESDEEKLENIDIKVIEQFLRKKKLLKINNL
jgi:hypothetical protein